jgi:regulator of PEP synthase PpsR (kinase-PPPase family)
VAQAAAERSAPIFYTLVVAAPRKALAEAAAKAALPTVDLLEPVLATLGRLLDATPQRQAGLYYESQKEYFDRLVAVEYTLHHDDGQRPHELSKADVVLVGPSRVSKSATCFVLAYNGIRAANVPIVPGCPLPAEVLKLDSQRVIGLTMNADRLQRVREIRMQAMQMGEVETYTDRRAIVREIHEANALMKLHGWQAIDASYRSIEDTAGEVLRMIRARRD